MQLRTKVPYAIKLQEMCTHEEADTRVFVHLKHAVEVDKIQLYLLSVVC